MVGTSAASGRDVTVGISSPSVVPVSEAAVGSAVEVPLTDVTCRALIPVDCVEFVVIDEVALLRAEEPSIVVDDGNPEVGMMDGIATGQNDHSALSWSQYRSNTNLRNPRAMRLDKQSAEASSS